MASLSDTPPSPPWHFVDLAIQSLQARSLGEGIRVAVLDSGVARVDGLFASLRSLTPSGAPSADVDDVGHGTMCASLIASSNPGAPGIAPAVDVISLRVMAGGAPIEKLVRDALHTAVASGCHVVSCSFTLSQAEQATLDAIRDASNQGIVIVAASGNDPGVVSAFPERTPNVLVVGPYGHDREPLQSRFGAFTDVLAPGVDLPVITTDGTPATFGESSGAAAVVSGVVALVLAATRAHGTARVGLALEGLCKSTAISSGGVRLLDPDRLLHAAQQLP